MCQFISGVRPGSKCPNTRRDPSTFGSYIKELLSKFSTKILTINKYQTIVVSTELSHPSPELSCTEYRDVQFIKIKYVLQNSK